MEDLKYAVKLCILVFFVGLSLVAGNRTMEIIWPRQGTISIVHYLCAENDEGDVSCGRIKDADIAKKISTIR